MATGGAGPIEKAVRQDVKDMGELVGTEATLAELAYNVAKAIDNGGGDDGKLLPSLSKELRLVLKQLHDGHTGGDDGEWGDMGSAE
jgi:hypothetical protein